MNSITNKPLFLGILDKDIFLNLKSELDNARHHINELETEVEKLRREKETLTIERNELKLTNMKDVDKEKFANKMLYTENERNKMPMWDDFLF